MKNVRVGAYLAVGGVCGAVAGAIGAGAIRSTGGHTGGALLVLAVVGAALAVPGGIVERSPRKVVLAALAGALGLVAAALILVRIVNMDITRKALMASALLLFAAYGALIATMHALVDEAYRGVSYSMIMGANGGLGGVALSFLVVILSGGARVNWTLTVAIYGACVWSAIAAARKLELYEREDDPTVEPPGSAPGETAR